MRFDFISMKWIQGGCNYLASLLHLIFQELVKILYLWMIWTLMPSRPFLEKKEEPVSFSTVFSTHRPWWADPMIIYYLQGLSKVFPNQKWHLLAISLTDKRKECPLVGSYPSLHIEKTIHISLRHSKCINV